MQTCQIGPQIKTVVCYCHLVVMRFPLLSVKSLNTIHRRVGAKNQVLSAVGDSDGRDSHQPLIHTD